MALLVPLASIERRKDGFAALLVPDLQDARACLLADSWPGVPRLRPSRYASSGGKAAVPEAA